jgi:pyruvate dehydrogenase E1 component beta subunit
MSSREIETDKATMEVEAVDEGTIGKLLIAAGTEGVKVNTPIAVLLQDGEAASDIDSMKSEARKRKRLSRPRLKHRLLPRRPSRRSPRRTFLPTRQFLAGTEMATMTVREALRDAMAEEMRANEDVFVMGEEVAEYQGRLQGHAGACCRNSVRAAWSTRRSRNMALPASASAQR